MELFSKAEYNELIERLVYSVRDEYALGDREQGIIETADGCQMVIYDAYHDAVLEHSANYNALFDIRAIVVNSFSDFINLKRNMVIEAIIADIRDVLSDLPEVEDE